jgi:murein L,D-transpeptidase YafK
MIFLLGGGDSAAETFKQNQHKFPRVRQARIDTKSARDSLLAAAGLNDSLYQIFMRALKYERVLELWAAHNDSGNFRHLRDYRFTSFCGELGPKRCQGDQQIPEGVYYIDRFNPRSNYHLSMGIDYPNKSDRIRKTKADPGGDIFIHGNRVTIGCIPIGDSLIEELYIFAVDAKSGGQNKIPVHIFPCRMHDSLKTDMLKLYYDRNPSPQSFWDELKPLYDYFEKNHSLPKISISDAGKYIIDTSKSQ